jgi:hypothetical protein
MTIRKVWFGSLGPFFYDDAVLVMDPDGIVTEYQAGVVVDGQLTVINPPVALTDVVRLEDLEEALEVIEPGTANGQMLYWDNTAGVWKHTEITELVWDDTNKRFGIGTATPASKLNILSTTEQLRASYAGSIYTSFTTNSSGYLLINPSGFRVIIGLTTVLSTGAYLIAKDQIQCQCFGGVSGMTVTRANGTEASPTIVSIGDHLGQLAFQGYDGVTVQTTGLIRGTVEGVTSAGNVPTGFSFWTGSSSGTITQKMALKTDGNLGVGTNTPRRRIDILDASNPQLRLTHTDNSVYTDFQTNSSGYLTINATGSRILLGADDSDKTFWGAGFDFSAYYDGASAYLKTDEVAASDLHITTGAAKTVVYDTSVWEDLNFDPVRSGGPASTRPDEVTINNVFHKEFTSANNQLCGSGQEVPHNYKLGTVLNPHAHIFLKSGESAGTTGVTFTVYWELRQSTGTTSGSVTMSATSAQLGTTAGANALLISGNTFAGSAELGAQLSLTIARTAGDAGDVIVTTYGVHYEKDTPGSRTILTK